VTVGQYDAGHGFSVYYDANLNSFKMSRNSNYRASGNIKSSVRLTVGSETILVHGVSGGELYVSKVK